MNDSADIADDDYEAQLAAATRRLKAALDSLESRAAPLTGDMEKLRRQVDEAQALSNDRADLAARLDQATAEAKSARDALESREAECGQISRETDSMLATIRKQVADALGQG